MLNSPIRVDLGSMPATEDQETFDELLILYRSIRQLHATISEQVAVAPTSVEQVADAALLSYYTVNNKSRLLAIAEVDVFAMQPVVGRMVSGQFKVRTVTSSTVDPFVGIVVRDAKAGEPVLVYTEPSVVSGFSGLTPGNRCFMTAAKTVTTTFASAFLNSYVIGVALSASDIRLKSYYGGY